MMRTSELIGPALEWAVEVAENGVAEYCPDSRAVYGLSLDGNRVVPRKNYSTDWAQGGPIIEREGIDTWKQPDGWCASYGVVVRGIEGPTPLIATMRCYCASKLGDEVEIPEELVERPLFSDKDHDWGDTPE